MYLWRPNDSEIIHYRICKSIIRLKDIIIKFYKDIEIDNISFTEQNENLIWVMDEEWELGLICKIVEV